MLRAAADALAERLLAALPPTRAYTRADLAGPDVPRAVGHFLAQSLDRRLDLELDEMRTSRTAWFAYDAPDVAAAEQAFALAVGRAAQIPAAEWQKAVEQTVHQVVPYLVAPAHTLAHFVYGDGRPTLPLAVIERRMRYFQPYGYLRDVVGAYAQQKGLGEIERDDFSRLLARIEARTGTAYDAEGLMTLTDDLFDTLGEGPERRVAREHLVRFFADKGMPGVVERLSAAAARVSRAETRAALTNTPAAFFHDAPPAPAAPPSYLTPAPTPVATPLTTSLHPPEPASAPSYVPPEPTPFAAPTPSFAAPAPPYAAPEPPAAPVPPDASVPQWQQVRPADAAPAAAERLAADASDATPLWKRLLRGDTLDEQGVHDEQAVLGAGAAPYRKRFVKELFGGDVRAYADALAHLAPLATWAEATRAIAATFRAREVDLYGDAAVAFTDLAEQRYLDERLGVLKARCRESRP